MTDNQEEQLILSETGLDQARLARSQFDWGKRGLEHIAKDAKTYRERVTKFFAREPIPDFVFKNICLVLGIDWQAVVEKQLPVLSREFINLVNPMTASPHTEKFSKHMSLKLRRFSGRGHIFEEFQKYIQKYDRGYFLVLADPGEGKSSIAAKYITDNECVYYFNSRRKGWNSTESFLETICNQLVEYGVRYAGLNSEYLENNARSSKDSLLLKLLDEISDKLEPSKKLIIAIDALDEVNLNSQERERAILYLPDTAELPKNVFFLLTSRRDREFKLPYGIPKDGEIDLKDRKQECEKDLKEYIQKTFDDRQDGEKLRIWLERHHKTSNEFETEIIKNSQRNFMYLTLVLEEIVKGDYQNISLENLPKGLTEYYDEHLDRMIELLKQNGWSLNSLRIVYVICEYEEIAIPFDVLVRKTKLAIEQVIWVLNHWRQFLDADALEDEEYNFYHESYVEHLKKKGTIKKTEQDLKEIRTELINDILGGFRFGS